jgi:hypothetical protein
MYLLGGRSSNTTTSSAAIGQPAAHQEEETDTLRASAADYKGKEKHDTNGEMEIKYVL